MYTVHIPPYEVLEEMFPASDAEIELILNGSIHPKLKHDACMWSRGADDLLDPDRLVSFGSFLADDDRVPLANIEVGIYPAFAQWLIDFRWQPYGTCKTLKLKEQFT